MFRNWGEMVQFYVEFIAEHAAMLGWLFLFVLFTCAIFGI